MEMGASPEQTATARSGNRQSAGCFVFNLALGKCLRKALHMLLRAVTRFRRLLNALARQPALVLGAIFRAPVSLANFVHHLLTSRPARLLLAAVASIICISLQYHRPTVADIQLSSSISLLFGMIKFQGSLALQLGPPEARKQPDQQQLEELRLNCPKDLKESIVRFLESQAAANHALQTPAAPCQLSPHRVRVEGSDAQLHQQQCPHDHHHHQYLEEQRDLLAAAERGASLQGLTMYDAFAFTNISPDPLAPADARYAECVSADAAAAEAFMVPEFMSYGSAGSAAGGFESCCSDTCLDSTAATTTTVTHTMPSAAAGPGAGASVLSLEALLPSTPPLGCSPPAKVGVECLAENSELETQGTKPLETLVKDAEVPTPRSSYFSLMSNVASLDPSMAPAAMEPQQGAMAPRESASAGCNENAHETI